VRFAAGRRAVVLRAVVPRRAVLRRAPLLRAPDARALVVVLLLVAALREAVPREVVLRFGPGGIVFLPLGISRRVLFHTWDHNASLRAQCKCRKTQAHAVISCKKVRCETVEEVRCKF
jgi:hypothetical protein